MMQPGTVSSHRVIGIRYNQHAQMVDDDAEAWHAQEDNGEWLAIEFTQPTPEARYSDWQIAVGVQVVADWCRRYGLRACTDTIKRHEETRQGIRCGKSDPGRLFPYFEFVLRVQQLLDWS
jgi:N-acetyl-anhydromuramyl-L-alanine amidase AmpD